MQEVKLVSKNWGKKDSWTLPVAKANGGYKALEKALTMTSKEIIDEVLKSGLRGRGGAGFPTGMKWGFVVKEAANPKYLVINGDEGEPGTVKDRYILSEDPHMFIEGCLIGAWALGAPAVYVYCRGEFYHQMSRLQQAIDACYANGLLGKNILGKEGFNVEMYVHPGAGAYICGEETALLESLEGKKGWPRLKPPFPANAGLFGKPTAVNNVETLAAVPDIISMGGEKYASYGPAKNGGTRLIAVSGHVNKPGTYEVRMDANLREIIYDLCGGIPNGRKLKAVVPGGSSAPVLTAAEVDTMIDFDSLKNMKTMAGSAGIMVIDDSVNMCLALNNVVRFYAHESCGQCAPCRWGTGWMNRLLTKIVSGQGEVRDVELLDQVAKQGEMRTICALFDGCAGPVRSYIAKFKEDFLELVKPDAPGRRSLPVATVAAAAH
jgi:NADH-quinone oxidoreductase subunit F